MRPATPHTTLWIPDTMTTRSAALITIALLAVLLAFVALAALFSPDISERAGGIVSTVLGSFATVLAGLLLFLRVETLNSKADDARTHAAAARTHAAAAAKVGEEIRHDIHNDVLKSKIRQAIREIEEDPDIHERRIDRIAEGVQKDRHNLKNRKAAERMRGQLESRGMPKRDNEGA